MGTTDILSRSSESFADRTEAGRLLGRELKQMAVSSDVVLGIPRGGVVVAREVARELGAAMDVAIARKLPAPGNPELAIGAVAENGEVFVREAYARATGADQDYLEVQKTTALQQIAERSSRYRRVRPKVPVENRVVIVTDDGVATGATMKAVLWAVRRADPGELIVALPVGPPETLAALAEFADRLICLRAPVGFSAVGQFYVRFDQTEDDELLRLLRQEAERQWES